MSRTSTFACEECLRRFAWNAAIAGRLVRCKCGAVFACPREEMSSGDGLYGVAPETPVARVADAGSALRELRIKGGKVMPAAAVEGSTGGGTLGYRAPEHFPARTDAESIQGLWMPLWLLGGGLLIEIAARTWIPQMWWTQWSRTDERVEKALLHVGLSALIGTALVLVLIGMSRVLMRIAGARPWPLYPETMDSVTLKLLAIMVAPSAALWLAAPIFLIVPGFAQVVTAVGEFAMSFALVGTMFDVDDEGAWGFVLVIISAKMVTFAVVVPVVMN